MSKRLIVAIVGLVLIAVIVVLNAVVFTVKVIEVDFDTESTAEVDDGLSHSIIAASGIKIGRNIFGVSESKIVSNIEGQVPGVDVINIERVFPNKVIIHVSKRVPVYIISYRESASVTPDYVLADGDMVALEFVNEASESYVKVNGFSLIGQHNCKQGEIISAAFGDEIIYLQNIAAGFYNAGLAPAAFAAFVESVDFDDGVINIVTESGVTIRLGSGLTSADIAERIPKAYTWYLSELAKGDDNDAIKGGILIYSDGEYIHNNY